MYLLQSEPSASFLATQLRLQASILVFFMYLLATQLRLQFVCIFECSSPWFNRLWALGASCIIQVHPTLLGAIHPLNSLFWPFSLWHTLHLPCECPHIKFQPNPSTSAIAVVSSFHVSHTCQTVKFGTPLLAGLSHALLGRSFPRLSRQVVPTPISEGRSHASFFSASLGASTSGNFFPRFRFWTSSVQVSL